VIKERQVSCHAGGHLRGREEMEEKPYTISYLNFFPERLSEIWR